MAVRRELAARRRHSATLMYERICKLAAGGDVVEASFVQLAALVGASEATARRAVEQLVDAKVLSVCAQRSATGAQLYNRIQLLRLDPPRIAAPTEAAPHPTALLSPAPAAPSNGSLFPELVPPEPPPPPDPLEGFDEWWSHWPRKVARVEAQKAWKQTAAARPLLEQLIEATDFWRELWRLEDTEGEYIPYPSTWLRGHRWEDERRKPRRGRGRTRKATDGLDDTRREDMSTSGETWNPEKES